MFRETKYLIEKLKILGYSKSIPIDSFQNPNFPLVSDILVWLVRNYDPLNTISHEISTEEDRILLVKTAILTMATKANLKLSARRIYALQNSTNFV
jgi:hypothetical protein